LALHLAGFASRARVTAAPVRSYRTVSPLPVRDSRVAAPSAVCSLLHFPAGFPGWALPTAVPCGVRTFLEENSSLRDCLTRIDHRTPAAVKTKQVGRRSPSDEASAQNRA